MTAKWSTHAIADRKGKLYEISLWDDSNSIVWRWIRKSFVKAHHDESWDRGFHPDVAYDAVDYTEIGWKEIISKIKKFSRRKTK